ncbi:MAG: zinc ribbon domain-containing protein [Nannocystaceae bacterium]
MADDADDILLPPAGDRAWLVATLGELVRVAGPGPLVVAPLLAADAQSFPDPWRGGAASLRRLLRRLARYAGIEGPAIEVELYDAQDERTRVGRPAGNLAGVSDLWLVQARTDRLRFAAESALLADSVAAAAAGARAIAHAWRALRGLTSADATDEQRRIDVTAVYLGFGRLTADSAHRYVTRGGRQTPTRLGLLSPRAVCYLLGVQLVARGVDRRGAKAIAGGLQSNQAAFLRRAIDHVREETPAIVDGLGLGPRDTWPPPPDLAALTGPLAEEEDEEGAAVDDAPPPDADRGIVGQNAGKPVFRVERRAGARFARVLVMGTMMLGGLATRPQMGEALTMGQVAIAAVVLGVLGFGLGSIVREARCSEPKCGASLRPTMTTCPRCGGVLKGTIHHPRERLAAEEALRAAEEREGEEPSAGRAAVKEADHA